MRVKKISVLLLACCLLTDLAGCGNTSAEEETREVLNEPVNAATNTEQSARRNLYSYRTYSGNIGPSVREYYFDEELQFAAFHVFPGEQVSAGTVLATADYSDILKRKKELAEKLASLEEQYLLDVQSIQDSIADVDRSIADKEEWGKIALGELERLNKEIDILELERKNLEAQITRREELYQLDVSYYEAALAKLEQEQTSKELIAAGGGIVSELGSVSYGDRIDRNTTMIAVADESKKLFRCEYIDSTVLAKAQQIYLVVDGVRYDVTNKPYDSDEYTRLVAKEETLVSTFEVQDTEQALNQGSFGVLVLISDFRKQALSVPCTSLHKDETGYYVNVVLDGITARRTVKTGFSDGAYTEILEGITEGENILLDEYSTNGNRQAEVTMDRFSTEYTGNGYMVYPDCSYVSNETEHGLMTMVSYQVQEYEYVNEGDLIATVSVERDEVTIYEKQLRLQRLKDKKMDLESKIAENPAIPWEYRLTETQVTALQRQAEAAQRSITELETQLAELEADYGVTEIRANSSGLIIWLAEKPALAEIAYQESIAVIADDTTCYVELDNENQLLSYGDEVTISYTTREGVQTTTTGSVATAVDNSLSYRWNVTSALVRIPSEAVADMAVTRTAVYGDYVMRAIFDAQSELRVMEHVPVIPKSAVSIINGQTYVRVLGSDGTVTARSFIAGGYNSTNYWVLDGLEEGMTLCLE